MTFFHRKQRVDVSRKEETSTILSKTINDKVQDYHRQFKGLDANICGIIHFYGEDIQHQPIQITIGSEMADFLIAAMIAKDSDCYAVSITLIRNRRDIYGSEYAVKETCLINKRDTRARIYESVANDWDGSHIIYSDEIQESSRSFSSTANLTHDILDALQIPWSIS